MVEGQGSLAPATGQRHTAGFEWRDEQRDNEVLPGGQGQVEHRAVFGQAELNLASGLALTAGARYDDHERFGGEWSARPFAVWTAASDGVVKGGSGHGYKAPNIKQILPGYREDEGPNTFFGNPALQPECNDTVELGAGWNSGGMGLQAMLFRNQVDNLIVPRLFGSVAGRCQYGLENIDRARLQCDKVDARAALPAGWQLGLNYACLDACGGNGQRLEKRPRHLVGAQVGWTGGLWRAVLRTDRQADRLIAPVVVGQPLKPLPDTTRVRAQVARHLAKGLQPSLCVDNLNHLELANESPLFTWAGAPRTWRVTSLGEF